jgi:hypothetical protein
VVSPATTANNSFGAYITCPDPEDIEQTLYVRYVDTAHSGLYVILATTSTTP